MEQVPAKTSHQSQALPPTQAPNVEPPTALANDGLWKSP